MSTEVTKRKWIIAGICWGLAAVLFIISIVWSAADRESADRFAVFHIAARLSVLILCMIGLTVWLSIKLVRVAVNEREPEVHARLLQPATTPFADQIQRYLSQQDDD